MLIYEKESKNVSSNQFSENSKTCDKEKKFKNTYVLLLTQPDTVTHIFAKIDQVNDGHSYIGTSYAKYVEQSGAWPLLLPWDLPWSEMEELLENTHGLFLPGGDFTVNADNAYTAKLRQIFVWAKKRNESGQHFFIMGVCMGMQEMVIRFSHEYEVLTMGGFHH